MRFGVWLLLPGCWYITDTEFERYVDPDLDGYAWDEDCEGGAGFHPDAEELPDGVDNDCDGLVDEGTPRDDADGDGYCRASTCIDGILPGDCDDDDVEVHPGVVELLDLVDQDCDGATDEGTIAYDDDGDGFCEEDPCTPQPPDNPVVTFTPGDCDDGEALTYPGATGEICDDGVDSDCDGDENDEDADGCVDFFRDHDGDGVGDLDDSLCLCEAKDEYTVLGATQDDCVDSDDDVMPGNTEIDDTKDNDCDDLIDEGIGSKRVDDDGDGYCEQNCILQPAATEADPDGDCEDDLEANPDAAAIHPGADEVEGIPDEDDDCDGDKDEGTDLFDDDGDGFCEHEVACTEQTDGDPVSPGDCDDTDQEVNPDETEVCDEIDNDCDGSVNEEDADGCLDFLKDGDGDGTPFDGNTRCLCVASGKYDIPESEQSPFDCDDTTSSRSPLLAEDDLADGLDNDCDDVIDEETDQYDDDSDGYCEEAPCVERADAFHPLGGDCDDADVDISPEEDETADGIDQDCDGDVDEGTPKFDEDGDGYCAHDTACSTQLDGTTPLPGDCNDDPNGEPAGELQSPGLTEVCGNLVDDDCDGLAGCVPSGVLSASDADVEIASGLNGAFAEVMALGDLDGDGSEEVGTVAEYTTLYVFFGPPEDGTLLSADLEIDGFSPGFVVTPLDYDGAGLPDLAVVNPDSGADDEGVFVYAGPIETDLSIEDYTVRIEDDNLTGTAVHGMPLQLDGDALLELLIAAPWGDDGWNEGAGWFVDLPQHTLQSPGSYQVEDVWLAEMGGIGGDTNVTMRTANLGDLNGDELDDFAFTTLWGTEVGVAYGVDGLPATLEYTELLRLSLVASDSDDGFGMLLATAGNVDGVAGTDLLVAAPAWEAAPETPDMGAVYVFSTAQLKTTGTLSAADAATTVRGAAEAGVLGSFVGSECDVDNNGVADLVIGAAYAPPNATDSGVVYVFYGPIAAGTIEADSADLRIEGASGAEMGPVICADVNGDGSDDVVVGSPGAGAMHVFFGARL